MNIKSFVQKNSASSSLERIVEKTKKSDHKLSTPEKKKAKP
jgi:hypothetical protein